MKFVGISAVALLICLLICLINALHDVSSAKLYVIKNKKKKYSEENTHTRTKNCDLLKAPYSSKVDIFIQERFQKLIYGINT